MKCSNMSQEGSWEVRLVRLCGFSDLYQIFEVSIVKCRLWLVIIALVLHVPRLSSFGLIFMS